MPAMKVLLEHIFLDTYHLEAGDIEALRKTGIPIAKSEYNHIAFDEKRLEKELEKMLPYLIGRHVEKIKEGINYLLAKNDLRDKTRYHEKLDEIKNSLEEFSTTNDYLTLKPALDIFHETAGMVLEGEDTYGTTIWNTNAPISGKSIILEDLFNDLEDLWRKLHKSKSE